MPSGGEIRAGRAFVEMYISDESVQASLANVRAKLRTFGAAVDAVGSASFGGMSGAAIASTARTGVSVGLLAATMGVLRASVYAVGNAFRVVFGSVTTSVTKAFASLGTLSLLVSKFAGKSKFAGLLNSFLSNSQMTEAAGRWTRFAGLITGSSALKNLGNRIERLGLGASIVQGLKTGGLSGGIGSALGASFRSAKSMVASSIAGLFTAPFRAVGGLMKGAIGGAGALVGIQSSGGGAKSATEQLTKAVVSGKAFAAVGSTFSAIGSAMSGVVLKVGGFAAAIAGPALSAAKNFVASATEMRDKAKETGKSLSELISEKYGDSGIISPADIEAGAALSDVMKALKQAMAAAWAQIGVAALPVLKSITQNMTMMANAVGIFLSQNREMITTVVQFAVKAGAVAGAIGALVAGFTAAGVILPMLANPLVMIGGGLAALVYFFPQIRQGAMDAFEYLFGSFTQLSELVGTTMQGMTDALAGGNLALAAEVLWAGLYATWLQGTARLRGVWDSMVTGIAGVFIDAFAGLQTAWINTTSFFLDTWVAVTRGISDIWTGIQNKIAKGFAAIFAKLTGQNVNDVMATMDEMQGEAAGRKNASRAEADKEIEARRQQAAADLDQIEKNRLGSHEENQNIHDEKVDAAKKELQNAKDALAAAAKEAAALKKNPIGKLAGAGAAAMTESTTLSTFSAFGAGRTDIAGFSKQIDLLQQIASNTDPKNGKGWGP